MGFTKPPSRLYDRLLFINSCNGYPWSWEKNNPCTESAVEGKLVGLYVKEAKEYKGEKALKLHLLIRDDSDETFCLRTGIDTHFARGFLLKANHHLDSGNLYVPVTVEPKLSTRDDKIVFCNMYAGGSPIKTEWDRDADLYDLARSIAEKYFPKIVFDSRNQSSLGDNWDTDSPHDPDPDTGEIRFDQDYHMMQSDSLMDRLGWTPERGRAYLIERYGKRGRAQLTDVEFMEFVSHLKELTKV